MPGRRPVLELLRAGGGVDRILIARELDPSRVVGDIRRLASDASVPVRTVPRAEVDRVARGGNHQGVVAVTARYRYTPLRDMLRASQPRLVFLDGVTDPHNLGSILRSADGAGFSGVVIPARRAAGVTGAVRRVSAGASEVVAVARVNSLRAALADARAAGVWIVGLSEKAADDLWSSELLDPPVGLVLGAEDRGLTRAIHDSCDGLVRIPLAGKISSLNVAVAGAVAMFEVARRAHSTSEDGRDSDSL